MNIERTDQGTFASGSCGGPGRPSKRLLALHERYKRKTLADTASALADDIPRLESELKAIDDEIAQSEAAFVEQIGPTCKHRAEIAVTLARARVAAVYVADPAGFGGYDELPADAAKREYDEVRRQLEDAQRELADTPEPSYDRVEALADADKWSALHAYETPRDRVSRLLVAEKVARKKAEAFGPVPPLGVGRTMEGDPFAVPRRGSSRQVMESVS